MAPKSAPFEVVVHYTGKKSNAEIRVLYADFYVNAVKNTLTNSNLPEDAKEEIVERLCAHFSSADLAA